MLYNCAILKTAWIQPASVAGRKGRKNAEASQKMLGHQIEVPPNHARSDYVGFGVPPIAGNLHIIQTHSTTWFYYQYRAWRPNLDYWVSMYQWTYKIHVGFPNLQVELSIDHKGTRIFSEICDDVKLLRPADPYM